MVAAGSRVVAAGGETAIFVDSLLIKREGDDISLDELLDEDLGKAVYILCRMCEQLKPCPSKGVGCSARLPHYRGPFARLQTWWRDK